MASLEQNKDHYFRDDFGSLSNGMIIEDDRYVNFTTINTIALHFLFEARSLAELPVPDSLYKSSYPACLRNPFSASQEGRLQEANTLSWLLNGF